MEKKLDGFFGHPTDDSECLCEVEALLSTLKNKSSDFNRWGREIEFLFEDENELLAEMETTTDFNHNASITLARLSALSALINKYQKSSESMNNPPLMNLPVAIRVNSNYPNWTYEIHRLPHGLDVFH